MTTTGDPDGRDFWKQQALHHCNRADKSQRRIEKLMKAGNDLYSCILAGVNVDPAEMSKLLTEWREAQLS